MMLKDLLEKRANVWDQMKAIREKATAEKRTEFTGEERTAWDAAEAELTTLTADVERIQRAEDFARTLKPVFDKAAEEEEKQRKVEPSAQYRDAYMKWARGGNDDLDPDEKRTLRTGIVESRALGIGTGGAGGYAIPQGFRDVLVETLKYYNAVRQVAMIITTDSGQTLPWPVNNDTANLGMILAENTAMTNLDVALTQEQLAAYVYTSRLVLVSYQLLQDSAIDIESFLARKLGQRIGRIQNQHFTTGTGTAQPLGLITGGTAVPAAVGSSTTIKYADLVSTMFRVDPAYRNGPNVRWMLSDTALAAIRNLVDTQGRPLWEPSPQVGTPDSLLGYGIVINNDLAVPAVSAKYGAFGDFNAGYIIRDVTGISTVRLDERFAEFLQVGWFAYARSDGTVQDTAAYTVLQNSAT